MTPFGQQATDRPRLAQLIQYRRLLSLIAAADRALMNINAMSRISF
jgi:hypothetical protein